MQESTFPQLYDAYITQFEDDLPFWTSVAETCGGPILELGCGTGRVLIELAKAGFEVEGIDNDPDMLNVAQSKLFPKFQDQAKLHLKDIRNFTLSTQFNLILIPCDTFSYFNNIEALQILDCAKAHLIKGGQLIMDLPNPEASTILDAFDLLEDEADLLSSYTSAHSNLPIQVSARQTKGRDAATFEVSWYFDELHPDGTVQRFEHELKYHMRSAKSMIDLLTIAGFTDISSLGDYDSSAYIPDSPQLIIKSQIEETFPISK